jgi:hypothetical protein
MDISRYFQHGRKKNTITNIYKDQPSAPDVNKTENPTASTEPRVLSKFDKLRETLLTDNAEEGWASKLHHYLNTME